MGGQDGNSSKFTTRESLEEFIDSFWNNLKAWHDETCIPINIGEYGFGRKKDQNERDTDIVRDYYAYNAKVVTSNGWSIIVWDDQGWFAVTREAELSLVWPYGLADAVLAGSAAGNQSRVTSSCWRSAYFSNQLLAASLFTAFVIR